MSPKIYIFNFNNVFVMLRLLQNVISVRTFKSTRYLESSKVFLVDTAVLNSIKTWNL